MIGFQFSFAADALVEATTHTPVFYFSVGYGIEHYPHRGRRVAPADGQRLSASFCCFLLLF
jgi:hypothetical protein